MSQTDFNFGHNDPSNKNPWGDSEKKERKITEHQKRWAEDHPEEITAGQVLKMVRSITETVHQAFPLTREILGGNNTMLPSADGAENHAPSPKSGMTYLRNEMLSRQPKEAKILAVRANDGKFGTQVVLKLSLDGKVVFWSITVKNNPNYRILERKFGRDENDWTGQKILIGLEQDDFSDAYYPRASFPAERTAKK